MQGNFIIYLIKYFDISPFHIYKLGMLDIDLLHYLAIITKKMKYTRIPIHELFKDAEVVSQQCLLPTAELYIVAYLVFSAENEGNN